MGRGFVVVLATGATLLVEPCLAEPPHLGHPAPERRPRLERRLFFRPRIIRPIRSPPLEIEPPDRFMPGPVERVSPLEEDQLPSLAPFSHGFHLSVPVGAEAPGGFSGIIRRYAEVGQALGACWTPPAGEPWSMVTLRVSFKRDGSINGEPRVPYVGAESAEWKSELAHSLTGALKRCTPLPFSPTLGSAVAGEVFAISFIYQDRR